MSEDEGSGAFLDASALYPSLLRNILMRLAMRDLFRAFWSQRVQDEWTRAVLRDRPHLPTASIERTRRLMDENIDDASVSGYEPLIETITLPDADDRHVLAAATHLPQVRTGEPCRNGRNAAHWAGLRGSYSWLLSARRIGVGAVFRKPESRRLPECRAGLRRRNSGNACRGKLSSKSPLVGMKGAARFAVTADLLGFLDLGKVMEASSVKHSVGIRIVLVGPQCMRSQSKSPSTSS